jgi:UDP-N-acetylglucosamine--N-acetylmuramyl-(pentapeptide) pyrophosphoryl-undecaprenol N-acetylglucosamine transferase
MALENIRDFFRFFGNIFRAFLILLKKKPDVIFSKGGFVALPVGIAAYFLKIPIVLHESDSIMGLSNRILSKIAQRILCAFPKGNDIGYPTPVRREFFCNNSKKGNIFLNRAEDRPLLFVFGGSQGAQAINTWIFTKSQKILEIADICILTGKDKLPKEKNPSPHLFVFEFLGEEFSWVLSAASVIVSRSGASTIAEISAMGKCAFLVPLASAANGEQEQNAKILEKKNAAIFLSEKDLFLDQSEEKIKEFLLSAEKRMVYEKNIRIFSDAKADEKIATVLSPFFHLQ